MVSPTQLQTIPASPEGQPVQYRCTANLDLYDSSELKRLATQAATGRYLKILPLPTVQESENDRVSAVPVCLCEDNYPGWLAVRDLESLEAASTPYKSTIPSDDEIQARIPRAIAFTHAAMKRPNEYLWGYGWSQLRLFWPNSVGFCVGGSLATKRCLPAGGISNRYLTERPPTR